MRRVFPSLSSRYVSLVKNDEQARAQFLAILETMGPGDPRTAVYRRKMTGMLFA